MAAEDSVPMLQSFGGTQAPTGIFGLGTSGVHMSFGGALPLADMAAMADSALGPAIRELHITVSDMEGTWEERPAAMPFRSVLGFLSLLPSVQQLHIKGWKHEQLLVRAEAINAFNGLRKLALGRVTVEGDLAGPCLTQIVCASLQAQLLTVLARPPPALTSILVPHRLNAVVPRAVLGIDVPRVTEVVCACPGAPRWTVSHESRKLFFWDPHNFEWIQGLITAVPCID